MEVNNILISGGYGNGNAGDEALMVVIYHQLAKQFPNASFCFFSDDPEYSKSRYNFGEFVYSGRFGLFQPGLKGLDSLRWITQTLLAYIKCNLFVQGGGTVLQDKTHPFFILFWMLKILFSQLLFKKNIMYGIGVGSISSGFNKIMIRLILNRMNLVTVRGIFSLNILKSFKVKDSILKLAADPVFLLSYDVECKKIDKLNNLKSKSKTFNVAFVIRRWHLRHISSLKEKEWVNGGEGKYKQMIEEYAAFADYLVEKHNAKIFFVNMSIKNPNDDRLAAKDTVELMVNKNVCEVIGEELSPSEIKAVLKEMDFVLGMRFHSLVLFAEFLKPMIGIAYGKKTYDLMYTLGLSDYVISVDEVTNKSLQIIFEIAKDKYNDTDFIASLSKKIEQQHELSSQIAKDIKKLFD